MKIAIMLICILISVKAFSQNNVSIGGEPAMNSNCGGENVPFGHNSLAQLVECKGDSIDIPANIKFLIIDGQVYEIKRTVKVEAVPAPLPRGLMLWQGTSGSGNLNYAPAATLQGNTSGNYNVGIGLHEMPQKP